MNKKFFVIDESIKPLSKQKLKSIEDRKAEGLINGYEKNRQLTKKRLTEEKVKLKHTEGRIIIKVDIDYKNTHRFESGITIYRGRQFNNLNRRETEPVNAIVIDSEYIPVNSEILIHPNSICETNRIHNYANISTEQNNSVRYYSIEEISAFLFLENGEWKPLKGFATALRVFKPYKGIMQNIPPEKLENILYITSGEFSGKIVQTLNACDYEVIFQGTNGREQRIIRLRHYEKEYHDREEIIMVRNDLTERYNKRELIIGLSPSDAKFISNG